MKFIHISDTHLKKELFHHYGRDPYFGLKRAIQSVNRYHSDADFVVISGDLADKGEVEAYIKAKEILATCKIATIPIIGNHDNREVFYSIFQESFMSDGFIQGSVEFEGYVCIFLDTKIPNTHVGNMCEKRFAWFKNELARYSHKEVFVFMHHNPMDIYIKEMDAIKFQNTKKLREVFLKNQHIKYLFFGHLHMTISGIWAGVPYAGVRSTNHQLSTLPNDGIFTITDRIQPAYGVVYAKNQDVMCISHEYIDEEIYAYAYE